MLMVISPAKTLDFDTPASTEVSTQCDFLSQAAELIKILKPMSMGQVAELMALSDKLAALNVARYGAWKRPFNSRNAKQAVLAFDGDVYDGLAAKTMSKAQLDRAQNCLRILSGLYGVLRPLDLMQPYRLEMGTPLANPKGKDLYSFWGNLIGRALNAELEQHRAKVLVNLASDEYFKSVDTKTLNARVVQPVFQDYKNDQYKIISFFAKKARGLMARYIVDERISDVEQLKKFKVAGYAFAAKESTENTWVFRRKEA